MKEWKKSAQFDGGTFLREEAETWVNSAAAFNPSSQSLNGAFERASSSLVGDDDGDEEALCWDEITSRFQTRPSRLLRTETETSESRNAPLSFFGHPKQKNVLLLRWNVGRWFHRFRL